MPSPHVVLITGTGTEGDEVGAHRPAGGSQDAKAAQAIGDDRRIGMNHIERAGDGVHLDTMPGQRGTDLLCQLHRDLLRQV